MKEIEINQSIWKRDTAEKGQVIYLCPPGYSDDIIVYFPGDSANNGRTEFVSKTNLNNNYSLEFISDWSWPPKEGQEVFWINNDNKVAHGPYCNVMHIPSLFVSQMDAKKALVNTIDHRYITFCHA